MRLAALAGCALALAAAAHPPAPAPLPPAGFTPPPAGSYALPPIQSAPDGPVLDQSGRTHRLAALTRGRITLLNLVYTRCTDPDGCPLATWALAAVRARLREDAALRGRVQLASLSFDPAHDRPEVLADYAKRMGVRAGEPRWWFLTARNATELRPLMDGFGQDLRVAADSKAVPGTEEFSHTLKVFLIDAHGAVREIYTSAYLMPEVVVNDIRTLAAER